MGERDYADSGLDIQYAKLDHLRRHPTKNRRPNPIIWDGLEVNTVDVLDVPEHGIARATILSCKNSVDQGFDMEVDGWFMLEKGEKIGHLRTWKDEHYEDAVQYPYFCRDRELRFWNVYRVAWPSGVVTEEYFTGNAGFWVEKLGSLERVYHCSHGMIADGKTEAPDFESLIVKLEIVEADHTGGAIA